jgi:hypothetical protein
MAVELAWVQRLFGRGRENEHLWNDAEEFLAYVHDALGPSPAAIKAARLTGLVDRLGVRIDEDFPESEAVFDSASFRDFVSDPSSAARWALAAECELFLHGADTSAEAWKPYLDWARSLDPTFDTIVTFNYDCVLERLGPSIFDVVRPDDPRLTKGELPRFEKVPVFKLHGSTSWVGDLSDTSISLDGGPLERRTSRVLAPPGRMKATWANKMLAPLWRAALTKIQSAWSYAVLGYGFPKTDAEARMRLLAGISQSSPGQVKRLDLVLGPDTGRPEARRVLELMRRRMGHSRPVFIDAEPDERPPGSYALITQHPLWVEDFLGDYSARVR